MQRKSYSNCTFLPPCTSKIQGFFFGKRLFLIMRMQERRSSVYCWIQSIQFSSATQSCPTLCDPMNHSTPGFPVHHQLLESTQAHVHQVDDAIQPSHPLSSPLLLPSVFLSVTLCSSESVLRIRWPKYWSFSFSISPSNEYSELISFRMDGLDLLAVQGTLKNILQPHSSKAQFFASGGQSIGVSA